MAGVILIFVWTFSGVCDAIALSLFALFMFSLWMFCLLAKLSERRNNNKRKNKT